MAGIYPLNGCLLFFPSLTLMKPRTYCKAVLVSIRVEVKRVVKVKAYKRIRRGKVEKVRTHYRKY